MLRASFGANERRRASEEGSVLIRGFFKGIGVVAIACLAVFIGVNAWVVLSSRGDILTLDEALAAEAPERADCIIVLGASVYADGSLSPILENRVDAAIDLYNRGLASTIIMSGDGREANYDEPSAMKRYAVERGVPGSDVCCDPGGYHTYDTMWRVANVYRAESCFVVTQEYHLYRSVFDARGVGLDTVGVVSDEGVYENQFWYDVREMAGRVQDCGQVLIGAVPDNPGAAISL